MTVLLLQTWLTTVANMDDCVVAANMDGCTIVNMMTVLLLEMDGCTVAANMADCTVANMVDCTVVGHGLLYCCCTLAANMGDYCCYQG